MKQFEFAAGIVAGRDHLQALKWSNCQDAYCLQTAHDCHIGVVSDGCGSGKHSEVGSKLIARLVSQSLSRVLPKYLGRPDASSGADLKDSFPYWKEVQDDIVAQLRVMAHAMGDLKEIVSDYFLATIFGFLITPKTTFIFSIGDGCYACNGQFTAIDFGVDNDPDYIAYNLLQRRYLKPGVGNCEFVVREAIPTDDLQSLLIATDGASKWPALENRNLPGQQNPVGPLSRFWTDNCYYENKFQLGRRLALMNMEQSRPDWEAQRMNQHPGLLIDDTTIIAVRRKP